MRRLKGAATPGSGPSQPWHTGVFYSAFELLFFGRLQMPRTAVRPHRNGLRDIVRSTSDYEAWTASRIPLVAADLEHKHAAMRTDPFAFFRGTFYRWAELWPRVCPDLEAGPQLLCVGDLHVENFGVWRDAEGRLVWGVNDFDEACEAAFVGDLVRLLASVMLARSTAKVRLKDEEAAEILTEGWLRTMTHDFWKKLNRMNPAAPEDEAGGPHATAALPEGAQGPRLVHRVAGMGSLGRPRVVALSLWLGGEVAREAKAMAPSAWLWARGGPAKGAPLRYTEILAQATRCPDPTLTCQDGWLTRRLAPDGSRVELSDLPGKRDDEKMFSAMGREVGNMVRRSDKAEDAVAFLKALPPKRLLSAAADMLSALEADFERFKAG
jgi:hypothetical protein